MIWLLFEIVFHSGHVESVREIGRWTDVEAHSRCESALEITARSESGFYACVPTVGESQR